MTVPEQPESRSRSRRAVLAGALGGLAAWAAASVDKVSPTRAASGDPLLVGNTSNNAGTSNTTLTTSSTGTALLVTQNGTGTALRGSAVGPGSIAGFFTAQNGTGVSGVTGNPSNFGVFAQNNGAAGTGAALRASGGNNHGVVASTDSPSGHAVRGISSGFGIGVYGFSSSGHGVHGTSGDSTGVQGVSTNGVGVLGDSSTNHGVRGTSNSSMGVFGQSATLFGVYGESASNYGVVGSSQSNVGVYGESASGYAGWFDANTHINGTLTKAGGAFKIDHPLDPANQYLQHSFVESPDMKNVYDGLVTLDAKGQARVTLPTYFEVLNRDLRYQLTAVGAAAPDLHVKSEVADGRFVIGGGNPGLRVCWQVTGIRQDPFAVEHPIVVEQAKSAKDKGRFLHPELYGQPKDKGMHPVPRPALEAPIR